MRRRITTLLLGAAALVSVVATTPGQAAALLCPPGCVIAGTVKAAGGLPDPGTISVNGRIDVFASTVTGDVAGAVSVGDTYHLSVYGPVSQDRAGNLSGRVTFHASRFSDSGYESFGETVEVSGTAAHLVLTGPSVSAALSASGSDYDGSVVYARTVLPSVDLPEGDVNGSARCSKAAAIAGGHAPESASVTAAERQLKATCRALP